MSDFDDIYDETEEDTETRHLVFSAVEVLFAVPIVSVREMLPVQDVVHIPNAPDWVRGVINVRGETFRLVDFRKRVGMQGLEDEEHELIAQLDQREEEHKNWVDELEEAITEDKQFEGEVDPHKCKFGRWYDTYKTNNAEVLFELKKFDRPHRAIHGTAEEVLKLKEEGKTDEAVALIERRKSGELARLIQLFDSLKGHIRAGRKEVVVLVETEKERFGIVVDKVEVVESLRINEENTLTSFQKNTESFARHSQVARREKEEDIVYLVEPDWIVSGAEEVSSESS